MNEKVTPCTLRISSAYLETKLPPPRETGAGRKTRFYYLITALFVYVISPGFFSLIGPGTL